MWFGLRSDLTGVEAPQLSPPQPGGVHACVGINPLSFRSGSPNLHMVLFG
jgi:hypothetical protein